ENGKVETTVKLNDDPEKIKETITGQPGDKVKVCLEESNDNSKYCQTIILISQYYQLNQPKLYHYHQYMMHLDFLMRNTILIIIRIILILRLDNYLLLII
ncbi:MAG TPA: hypothetical protein VEW92_02090, partial [Nitrososphaeraceae archaeon]|nr:hypothetical protein [Nitrososphaeraceae archaeon]